MPFCAIEPICRSKLHDDESRLIQVYLMITKMMTKSPREYKRMISRTRFKNQEKFGFKIQEKKSRRLHKGSIEKIFPKTNIAQFCFSKEFYSKFSKLPEFLLFGNRLPFSCNRLPVAKCDFKSFQLNLQCSN